MSPMYIQPCMAINKSGIISTRLITFLCYIVSCNLHPFFLTDLVIVILIFLVANYTQLPNVDKMSHYFLKLNTLFLCTKTVKQNTL